jgi:predicted nucleic acid-binding protein
MWAMFFIGVIKVNQGRISFAFNLGQYFALIAGRRVYDCEPLHLPMDAQAFQTWAKLMHGQSDTVYEDAMIAATAINHHLTVVTRNTQDFKRFEVSIFNPFDIIGLPTE